VDAVKYFAAEIMPLLRTKLPGAKFNVVGSHPPPEIKALASEDIIIMGFVDDLNSLLNKMRVSVAPLRYGAGIKGKIGTVMTVGLPAVATPQAAEGMSLTNGENILVAANAEQFADAVVKLYQDELLWNQISQSEIDFAGNAWGAKAAYRILSEILLGLDLKVTEGSRKLKLYNYV
jgi:glycosyltransferase involved in cell wall biosynthesis